MINSSEAYQAAITADSRRTLIRAALHIIDPDMVYLDPVTSAMAPWSKTEQLHDMKLQASSRYITLERNRWLLDGSFRALPDDLSQLDAEFGWVGKAVSDDQGLFSEEQIVELHFSNVSVLQACSIHFPNNPYDGAPADFTVEILQGGTVQYSIMYLEPTMGVVSGSSVVELTDFTVYNPDTIRVSITRWSKPGRRAKVLEIIPGVFEVWDNSMLASFNVKQQANFSCLALPYGTCTLSMDNIDRRFEPRRKDGLFQSIEERQGIDISIGVRMEDGEEMKRVGIFYQYAAGWKTGHNGGTMQWDLVDIIGLLANREYLIPDELPTTLSSWIAGLVSQLGVNFSERWSVDERYADRELIVDRDKISGKTCGELLRYACMATETWPRADAETGYLAVEPFWNQGNRLTLENLTAYPTMKANGDLAAIIFTLNDGSDTKYIVSGNATASSETVSVNNPFIHDEAGALTAARMILSTYGGNRLETTGRGDPACEIGDVDTVELDESTATTARRMYQTFMVRNGVLRDCQSILLQADGSFLFEAQTVITTDGTWQAPAGVTQLRLILVGGGSGGTAGTDGSFSAAGIDGKDGLGGMIWTGTININPEQTFKVVIGQGGAEGQNGGVTTFGAYSSANGSRYSPSYTDVASGNAYGRPGVKKPLDGTGDGGIHGAGGRKGERSIERDYTVGGTLPGNTGGVYIEKEVISVRPGKGTAGTSGAAGCVVIWWDKEEVSE